jgi:acetyl esterase
MATTAGGALTYDPTANHEVKITDVEYRNDGTRAWLCRVYQPQGAGPFPMLLAVHGGAWQGKERFGQEPEQNESTHIALAAGGLVVASVQFRTSQDAPHPAAQEDISYATRWLKAHAQDFNGRPEMLGGAGWSSGGHQVMLGAMRSEQYATVPLAEAPETDASLAYVIMGWPVIDPLARYRLAQGRGNQELMGHHLAYFGSEEGMVENSPPHILQRGEPVATPPALLVQGAADESLSRMMAEEFVEAYSLAGGVIEMGKYPGEPHGFLRQAGSNSDRAMALIKSFIARQLAD